MKQVLVLALLAAETLVSADTGSLRPRALPALQVYDADGQPIGRYMSSSGEAPSGFATVIFSYNGSLLTGRLTLTQGKLALQTNPLLSTTADCSPPFYMFGPGLVDPLVGTNAMSVATRGGKKILAVGSPSGTSTFSAIFRLVSDACPVFTDPSPTTLTVFNVDATYDITGLWNEPLTLK